MEFFNDICNKMDIQIGNENHKITIYNKYGHVLFSKE